MLGVEATLPRIEEDAKPDTETSKKSSLISGTRISRDELLEDMDAVTKVNAVFLAMIALSAIVAGIGLIRDNVAVVIGAMVIAPLLGPNVALSLATVLGDLKMILHALRTNAIGIGVALLIALIMGFLFHPDPAIPQLAARSQVGLYDIVLALASGAAGTLAFTSGFSATLVGVMVAVALMPPTIAVGLHAGSGHFWEAGEAATLLVSNIICINLASAVTFLLAGVRARTWWEADRARHATRIAITSLLVILAGLIALLVFGPFDDRPIKEKLSTEQPQNPAEEQAGTGADPNTDAQPDSNQHNAEPDPKD